MSIFIRSSSCISAQNTFGQSDLLQEIIVHDQPRLRVVEPDYTKYIDSKSLRRMGHVIKMGIAAAKDCLQKADVEMPGAITTGTTYGCMDASATFLIATIEQNEEDLSPTMFMQSTHNTVGAQIALMLKCHAYNNTFVHKGFSFESALQDAIMLLNENETTTVLTGGIDEMTDISFTILNRLAIYKREPVTNTGIYKMHSKGTIGGEGAAFFLLSNEVSKQNLAELSGLEVFYQPESDEAIERKIIAFLRGRSLKIEDIDVVITGRNGDMNGDRIYDVLDASLFAGRAIANYKHLCGEYPTSSSFALWLAADMIRRREIPSAVLQTPAGTATPERILIYNHYLGSFHSMMLLSRPE